MKPNKMKKSFYPNPKFLGILLGSIFLWSCSKDDPTGHVEKAQLVLTASAVEIEMGETVTFEVTADGTAVDADIYINDNRISGTTHTFEASNTYTVLAKKEGHPNSEAISIRSYKVDVHIAGTEYFESTGVAMYWKNGTPVELTDGSGHAQAFSLFIDRGDVYVAGVEYNGPKAVATYWKNGVPLRLTDENQRAYATSIVVDNTDVYVAGFDSSGLNPAA